MQTYPPGSRIGQYEIASRPMMGGMGVVYFALDHGNDGRPVALKTFRPELLPDRAARDRFLREGTAWIELGSHPHIVRCYKAEYIDFTAYLVLEMIANEEKKRDASLRSWLIPGQPLPLEQALLFALQIAHGMQHATEKIQGFVHRDLKPENVLVGADKLFGTKFNRLRVTDFGLAKILTDTGIASMAENRKESDLNQVQFTRGVGTPLYMAPEQWKGEPVGIFTDIYAFGCILFEMLSGQRAARGKTEDELRASHSNGMLQAIPTYLPKYIDALIENCLALKPIKRARSWNEVIDHLERAYHEFSGQLAPREITSPEFNPEELIQVGWSYNNIAHSFMDIGEFSRALEYAERANQIGQNQQEWNLIGISLGNIGIVYQRLGAYNKALEYMTKSLELARQARDQRGEGTVLGNMADVYAYVGKDYLSIDCCKQALDILHSLGDLHGEGRCLGILGKVYTHLKDFSPAIESHEQSLALMRAVGDKISEGMTLGNLGETYRRMGELQIANNYFKKHLEIAQSIGDLLGEGIASSNLGITTALNGENHQAIEYFEHSLSIARSTSDRHGEGTVLGNLGVAYIRLKEIRTAIKYLEESLLIKQDIGDRSGEVETGFNLVRLYGALGESSRAESLAQRVIDIYISQGFQAEARSVEEFLKSLQK